MIEKGDFSIDSKFISLQRLTLQFFHCKVKAAPTANDQPEIQNKSYRFLNF